MATEIESKNVNVTSLGVGANRRLVRVHLADTIFVCCSEFIPFIVTSHRPLAPLTESRQDRKMFTIESLQLEMARFFSNSGRSSLLSATVSVCVPSLCRK